MQRFSLILFLLLSATLSAQTLHWDSAGTALGTEATILIGDQLNLVVKADTYPSPQELSQNDILLLSMRYDTAQGQAIYVATCFEEGTHRLALGGSDSLLLTVNDMPGVDTTKADIKDIAALMKEPYTLWEILRWVLLALGVGALVWLAIVLIRRKRRHEPLIALPSEPALPPHQVALSALEQLRQQGLWQAGRVKEYHTELTDILRRYLHDRFGIESQEMTSDQTLEAFLELKPSGESHDLLRRVLRTADMVKFAKAEPQGHEHDLALSHAVQFVESTATLRSPLDPPLN